MTKYQLLTEAYNIFENSLNENKKDYINSKIGLKESLYCTFISWISNYLSKSKYGYSLYELIKMETGICITKEIQEKVYEFINENKYNIEVYYGPQIQY